jgi:uncharacterized protein YprB with RNaseH-like and TPR domain
MSEEMLERLRRLGVTKGPRNLRQAPARSPLTNSGVDASRDSRSVRLQDGQIVPLEQLLPGGRLEETELGACFVLDHVYPLAYRHGADDLGDLLKKSLDAAATICNDDRLAGMGFQEIAFLDTETTGLFGAGTIAFMVGVGFFDPEAFVVRQYFLRDHGDEPAMLQLLAKFFADRPGLITFNGRSFDLPLLENRYVMNRMDEQVGDLLGRPHLDLLPPSRRLWRSRIGSCSLSSLEQNILGLNRTSEDVPGWAIPGLYMEYLRTGDARDLLRVFYHNRIDMLSMATLSNRILRQFNQPRPADEPLDIISLARWQIAMGMPDKAEKMLRMAAEQDLPLEIYHQALYFLGQLLKRNDRREEAVPLWQQMAVTSFGDVSAHVELAKYYEWHKRDLELALEWTQRALSLSNSWPSEQNDLVRFELEHRMERLERRISRSE